MDSPWVNSWKKSWKKAMRFPQDDLQDGAPKIAKLVYKWLNNGLW